MNADIGIDQIVKTRMDELRPSVEEYHRLVKADEALTEVFGPIGEEAPPTPRNSSPRKPRKKAKKNKNGGYTSETKAKAVARYSETGSFSAVSREFGVAFSTVKGWVKQARKAAEAQPEEDFPRTVTTDV